MSRISRNTYPEPACQFGSPDRITDWALFETVIGPNGVLFGFAQELRPFVIVRGGTVMEARPKQRSAVDGQVERGDLETDTIALIVVPDQPDMDKGIFMS